MRVIGARKTELKEIPGEVAHQFYKENHRQKSNEAIFVRSMGLYNGEELVGAVSFCAPRTAAKNREYSQELYRLCFKEGVRVPGGASRLIKGFIDRFKPADFFTYQDMGGEGTAVYEESGMTLSKKAGRKTYLLAPGIRLEDASWGEKEIFTMGEVVRRGPDTLLGTQLGEIFDEDGNRLSNPRIFTEILGWTEVVVPGDRVYEWVDLERTYYTYKITATDSDKYYLGVSHVKTGRASEEECLTDGYWGSGGSKFRHWREKHQDHLKKEILGRFPRRLQCYKAEEVLVGDLYRTDPNCLNSSPGGTLKHIDSRKKVLIQLLECPIHGVSKHRGALCGKCSVMGRNSLKECPIHGLTTHTGNSCYSCLVEKKLCAIHGESTHIGNSCYQCAADERITIKTCTDHGDVLHQGGSCCFCVSRSAISTKHCPLHGETKFKGEKCATCIVEATTNNKECLIHGVTTHQGGSCSQCVAEKVINYRQCRYHGWVKHHGEVCSTCVAQKSILTKVCPRHGETKFKGDSCFLCVSEKTINMRYCPHHGTVKHHGENCATCSATNSFSQRECPRHGMATHRGKTCTRCSSENSRTTELCPTHGEVTFMGGICSKCRVEKMITMKFCSRHQKETKHRGNSCQKCTAEKSVSLKLCPLHGESKHSGEKCCKCIAAKARATKEAKKSSLKPDS